VGFCKESAGKAKWAREILSLHADVFLLAESGRDLFCERDVIAKEFYVSRESSPQVDEVYPRLLPSVLVPSAGLIPTRKGESAIRELLQIVCFSS
jgi:hypothetical protein